MNRLSIAAGAALLLAMGTGAAVAADALAPVEAAPAFSWTGGYIGVQAGYGWGDGRSEFTNGDYGVTDPDGFLGGAYIGYNQQLANNVVLGVEADFAWAGMNADGRNFHANGDPFPDTNIATHKLDWSGAVRARLGYAFDRFLPYVAAGVAFGDVTFRDRGELSGEYVDDSNTHVGWTIGAGAEYAFTDRITLRGEYRYSDFGSEKFPAGVALAGTTKLETHDIRFGLAYRF